MASQKILDSDNPEQPQQHAPVDPAPRGSKAAAFDTRSHPAPRIFARKPDETPPSPPAPEVTDAAANARDWDFALPSHTLPKEDNRLLDTGADWRRQQALHPPSEAEVLTEPIRERFAGNWERLASEPPRSRGHNKSGRKKPPSLFMRRFFPNGRLDIRATIVPLLLLMLLVATIIYGSHVLGSIPQSPPPAAEPEEAPEPIPPAK